MADFRVTICDYFRAKTSLKFAISTGILFFCNSHQLLYRGGFCQYCWKKSDAFKRFPVALPTSLKCREIRLDCSENRGERPQFRSSCFQTGPEKVVLSTPQARVRASFSGGQTRS